MILLLAMLVLWSGGFLLAGTLGRRSGGGGTSPVRDVSLIVPARNEERNLPALLQSIAAQPEPPLEVLVVDDGSTDRTAEVAGQLGARVLASAPLPDGWRGKPWACHQGAQAAKGRLLLFVDADTWFERGGLAGIRGGYGGGAFSVGPYHAIRRPYENLSLFFNLNMIFGTVPDGLFGQCLLVDRENYWRAGGHEAVRDKILENFWLAAQFRRAGIPVRSVCGRGALSLRMYPNGLRELLEGWTKGFASGARKVAPGMLVLTVAWMSGLMLAPLGWLLTGDALRWAPAYLLCCAQVAWISRRVGAFRWYAAVCYPVPLLFFFGVFVRSSLRSGRTVRWKGREIRAD